MNRIKRLEAIERRLLRPKHDAESLRVLLFDGITELATSQLNRLADVVEIRVCDRTVNRHPQEGLEAFKTRVLAIIQEDVMSAPMPIQGLAEFYRLLPVMA